MHFSETPWLMLTLKGKSLQTAVAVSKQSHARYNDHKRLLLFFLAGFLSASGQSPVVQTVPPKWLLFSSEMCYFKSSIKTQRPQHLWHFDVFSYCHTAPTRAQSLRNATRGNSFRGQSCLLYTFALDMFFQKIFSRIVLLQNVIKICRLASTLWVFFFNQTSKVQGHKRKAINKYFHYTKQR